MHRALQTGRAVCFRARWIEGKYMAGRIDRLASNHCSRLGRRHFSGISYTDAYML
jgi:hypothetical protein